MFGSAGIEVTPVGLEKTGAIIDERCGIAVDSLPTHVVPHIYAIGQGHPSIDLTPVAYREGHVCGHRVRQAYGSGRSC